MMRWAEVSHRGKANVMARWFDEDAKDNSQGQFHAPPIARHMNRKHFFSSLLHAPKIAGLQLIMETRRLESVISADRADHSFSGVFFDVHSK